MVPFSAPAGSSEAVHKQNMIANTDVRSQSHVAEMDINPHLDFW